MVLEISDFESRVKVTPAGGYAKKTADIVVFSIHWGPNMRQRPSEQFKRFARAIIDSGADIVAEEIYERIKLLSGEMGTKVEKANGKIFIKL